MKVIPLQSEQNATIYLEVDEDFQIIAIPSSTLGGSVAGGSDVQTTFGQLKQVSATIAEVCRSIYQQVEEDLDAISPNELVMEFGVKLGGEAGIPYITKGTAEAAIKVTAKWNRSKTKEAMTDV